MKCPNCDEDVTKDQRRCPNCGAKNPGFEKPGDSEAEIKTKVEKLEDEVKVLKTRLDKKIADDNASI